MKNELIWLDTEYIRNDITMQPVLVNDTLWYTLFDSHGYNHLFSTLKGLMDYVCYENNWGTGIQFDTEDDMIKYLEEI